MAPAWPSGRSDEGISGGQAIFSKSHLDFLEVDKEVRAAVRGADTCCRWAVGILRLRGAAVLVAEVYLKDGIGVTGYNWLVLQPLFDLVQVVGLPFVAGGDWQTTPQLLDESGWPDRMQATVVPPQGADSTCSGTGGGRVIDFFVVSRAVMPMVQQCVVDEDVPFGPHLGVVPHWGVGRGR